MQALPLHFDRLTGAENFFIWRVRMLDVLADKDILYVTENNRPADPIPEAEADVLVTDDYEDDFVITCTPVASNPVASNPVASNDTGTAEASQPSQEALSQAAREAADAEKQKRVKAHEAYTSYATNVYESQEKMGS
jgi:hypothetical protein